MSSDGLGHTRWPSQTEHRCGIKPSPFRAADQMRPWPQHVAQKLVADGASGSGSQAADVRRSIRQSIHLGYATGMLPGSVTANTEGSFVRRSAQWIDRADG
jgi:hypothetical protein